MFSQYLIFILQMLSYLSIIPLIIYGGMQHWLIAFVMYFMFGCIGMIITYHRLLSHRSFKCPKAFEYFGTVMATLSLTGSAITWVAMHRQHHKYADTEKDPHSPDYLGWWRVQFLTAFAKVNGRYGVDLMRNPFYVKQHKYYFAINFLYALSLVLIDPFAIIYAYLVPAAFTLMCGTLVLSSTHRDYQPINSTFISLLTWGDGYHKVHHDSPNLTRIGKYDMSGIIIGKFFKDGRDGKLER